ncbi:glycosyltransferase family 4 protein [uncultured Corynebacterium sp.]|uniref:glycosyltransferase family 4 protein n=1 Tax=uncultured Corynebacterium sp. TaxID=159447 RepID=UPI00288B3A83|nr:glycosyltransferase family 4 protein [uncultured Corynebacterium sp.]
MVISHYWYPENGVPQRRWQWLTGLLVDEGYSVTAIAPPPHYLRNISTKRWWQSLHSTKNRGPETGPQGEKIDRASFIPASHSLTSKSLNQLWSAISTIRIAATQRAFRQKPRPDLVIGTVPAIPTAVASYAVAKVWKSPLVIDLRDAWPELLETSDSWNAATGAVSRREKLLSGLPMTVMKRLATWTLNRIFASAEAIIVTSEQHRFDLIDALNTTPERVVTVRNVFPPEIPLLSATQSSLSGRTEEDRTPESTKFLHVLYAGTIGRAQNLSNAVIAAHLAKQRGVHIKLRLIGAGAAKQEVVKLAQELGVDVEVFGRVPPDQLQQHYVWADTALVHLTDWPPLSKAVPSKTFELMALGIHITGVVSGEAAQLIDELGAGSVVSPENPRLLAETWTTLARDRSLLNPDAQAAAWVEEELSQTGPTQFLRLVEEVINATKESNCG